MCLKERACGERLKPSQESRVPNRLECYLELGLYPEGHREPLRNLSTGWGTIRFERQFHSETKQGSREDTHHNPLHRIIGLKYSVLNI